MKKLVLILVLLAVSCAKVREENQVPDGNEERYSKSIFTGLDAVKSNDVRNFSDYENRFKPIDPKKGKVWLSKVTVTNVSALGGPVFIGLQMEEHAGYFKFTKDQLEYYSAINSNLAHDGKTDTVLYTWNVDHSEYRYGEVDGRPTNSLEEDNFIPWNKKSNFKIDWASDAELKPSLESKIGTCWVGGKAHLIPESREITDKYISFTKKITMKWDNTNPRCGYASSLRRAYMGNTFQYELTYSFKLYEAQDYEPYVYNGEYDPLIQKYGYFKTTFEEEKPYDHRKKVNFLMNRWNPKKTHTFYFAPGFPEKYKWIYKTDPAKKDPYGNSVLGIMDRTNKIFEENGLSIRIEIKDAPEGVRFGDIRYSFIKWMEESNPSSPLGYGPSDANPFTGEIHSANSMVWTGSLVYYTQLIDEWLKRNDPNEGSSQSIYAEMSKIMETEGDPNFLTRWLDTSRDLQPETEAGYVFKKMLPDFTYGVTFWAPFTVGHKIDDEGNVVLPADETDVFEFKDIDRLQQKFGHLIGSKELKFLKSIDVNGKEKVDEIRKVRSPNDLTIYSAESALEDVPGMLLQGKTPQEVIDTILYRVAIHEFGHNVGLRHNFYGSVDKNNFTEGVDQTYVNEQGQTVTEHHPAVSSSVMDYLSLDGEMHSAFEWENYDKAAIAYAYSSGKVDHSEQTYPEGHAHAGEKKHFLFCTDEHRVFNALCNTWDMGTTPTEILMSLIETYQKSYFTTNRRFDRAYWDTSSYDSRIFSTMWDIKKFMMLDQAAFSYSNKELSEGFSKQGISKKDEDKYFGPIHRDIRRAVKISVAFYNAVLQQSNVERQYFSEYDEPTGALLRKGIFADKLYATYFLLGDDSFIYNPNIPVSYASFLEYEDDPDVGNAIKKVAENLLTERVDSEPGFINFARLMYADSAVNYYNQNDAALANRFKMTCFPPEKFADYFGKNPFDYIYSGETEGVHLVADVINVLTDLPAENKIHYTEFSNELSEVGVAMVDGRVYVASKAQNEVAFNLIKKYRDAYRFGDSTSDDRLGMRKQDIRDMRFLYRAMTGAEDYCL